MLNIKNLDKFYSRGRQNAVHAINDVTLSLPDKGMVAIYGKSGCGKTTLLNVIGGLDKADKGEVLLDGESITTNSSDARNINIGYIFQNYNLQKNATVYENVAMSLRLCGVKDEKLIEKRVMAALTDVEMDKYKNRMPDALSGGQQQRVAIARAIVKNPKMILADEPTGNLDEHNTLLVMDLLRSIAKDHLVLLVTHEANLIDLYCDKVIEILDGRITGEKNNELTEGYIGRSANDVYLGDMQKSSINGNSMRLEFFGDDESKPECITIISHKGTLYIKADTDRKLKFIDNSSEIKVHNGTYEESAKRESKKVDPILTEPFECGKTGRMYNFKSAVKSGFRSNFGKKKKGRAFLFLCLIMFSAVIVVMSAAFGVTIKSMDDIKYNYHSKGVSVQGYKLTDEDINSLYESGDIDFVRYHFHVSLYDVGNEYYNFRIGDFETFRNDYNSYFGANALPLPQRLMNKDKLLVGTCELENDNDIVITSAFADKLLDGCGVDYIDTYEDLLYTLATADGWYTGATFMRVVGIVDESDAVVYKTDYAYTKRIMELHFNVDSAVCDEKHYDKAIDGGVKKGEIYVSDSLLSEENVGKQILFNGRYYTVRGLIENEASAEEFSKYLKSIYGYDISESLEQFLDMQGMSEYKTFEMYVTMFADVSVDEVYNLPEERLEEYRAMYEDEIGNFERQRQSVLANEREAFYGSSTAVVMNTEDYYAYIELAGESDKAFNSVLPSMKDTSSQGGYMFISSNAEKLAEKLEGKGFIEIYTSDDYYEYYKEDYTETITVLTVMLVVVIIVMSICLYFIMRSALMSDIKTVGISRAIGASKKNIVYRYFIETCVLFVLTVFVGYLVVSIGIFGLMSVNKLMLNVVYYPVWLAIVTLLGLFGVSAFCGILPVRMLLSKSPAEILSKYDI